jgi:hypothetical protein
MIRSFITCTIREIYNYNYQIKEEKMARACSTYGKKAYWVLMTKPEGNMPLGRPRRRWESNMTMYLREIEWGGTDCIHLAQDRDQWRVLATTVMNLRVPSYVRKFMGR